MVIRKLKNENYSFKIQFFKDVYIDNKLISENKKISSGVKNYRRFIGYMDDNYKIKLLCIILPKRSTYVKSHGGEAIWMHFVIEDDELLKKYNGIWNKLSNSIEKILIVPHLQ